jgi:hypothetical protein
VMTDLGDSFTNRFKDLTAYNNQFSNVVGLVGKTTAASAVNRAPISTPSVNAPMSAASAASATPGVNLSSSETVNLTFVVKCVLAGIAAGLAALWLQKWMQARNGSDAAEGGDVGTKGSPKSILAKMQEPTHDKESNGDENWTPFDDVAKAVVATPTAVPPVVASVNAGSVAPAAVDPNFTPI